MKEEIYGEEGYTVPGREHYTVSGGGRRFYMLAFIIGGGLGALLSLLLAPQQGSGSREKVRELSLEVKEKAGLYCEETVGKVNAAIDKGMPLIKTAIDAGIRAWETERRRRSGSQET